MNLLCRLGQVRVPSTQHVSHPGTFPLEIYQGEILGVAGEAGAGKSLFLRTLQKQLLHTERKLRVVLLAQPMHHMLPDTLRLWECVQALHPQIPLSSVSETFQQLGIPAKRCLQSFPYELPPELRIRCAIAIACLSRPHILLLDTPLDGLERYQQGMIAKMIYQILDEQRTETIVLASREPAILANCTHRSLVLCRGDAVEMGSSVELFHDPRHPYTLSIMGLAQPSPERETLPLGDGCLFADRCPIAQPDCTHSRPAMRTVAERDVRCLYVQ